MRLPPSLPIVINGHEWPRATKLATVTLISALAAAIDMVCACVSLSRVAIKNGPDAASGSRSISTHYSFQRLFEPDENTCKLMSLRAFLTKSFFRKLFQRINNVVDAARRVRRAHTSRRHGRVYFIQEKFITLYRLYFIARQLIRAETCWRYVSIVRLC